MGVTIDELTKNNKREMDEITKIYNKMKDLQDNKKALIYAMMAGAIKATIEFRE